MSFLQEEGDDAPHCDTYCSHGGVCELDRGHEGLHDSRYCQWADTEAITRDAANALIAGEPGGMEFLQVYELIVPREIED